MTNETKLSVIKEIISWPDLDTSDNEKVYFIQSFLLNWITAEQIHDLTKRKKIDYLTTSDILEYARVQGNRAAADLLLLAGPDGYNDNYNSMMEYLGAPEYKI